MERLKEKPQGGRWYRPGLSSSDSPRRVQLREWLDKIGATKLATVRGPNACDLTIYAAGCVTFILQVWYERPEGEISWDLYAPVTDSGETAATFAAFEAKMKPVMGRG